MSNTPEGTHGITLLDHARIAAELAEGDRSEAEVLGAHRLTPEAWSSATQHWLLHMADDASKHGAEAVVAVEYSEAFAQAQDALAAAPKMSPEGWARLVVDVQRSGDPAGPLSDRQMSLPDYLRLARSMARLLSTDEGASRRFAVTYERLQQPEEEAAASSRELDAP